MGSVSAPALSVSSAANYEYHYIVWTECLVIVVRVHGFVLNEDIHSSLSVSVCYLRVVMRTLWDTPAMITKKDQFAC